MQISPWILCVLYFCILRVAMQDVGRTGPTKLPFGALRTEFKGPRDR